MRLQMLGRSFLFIILLLNYSALAQAPQGPAQSAGVNDLFVTVGKSLVVESQMNIQRVSVGDSAKAEAFAVSPREILVNGKVPGETSVIMWQQGGNRLMFDLHVRPSTTKTEVIQQELEKELPGQNVTVNVEDGNVFLRGNVKDLVAADRAVAIASTLGRPINLLRVAVPASEQQILLKVRFADVDRAATLELGANYFSTGAGNTIGSVSTQQFAQPRVEAQPGAGGRGATTTVTLTDALNVFLFRPDLNIGATIRALQTRRLLQILAEPNLLAMNGKPASFLAGGEFPVPVAQAGVGGAGVITIQWREFGIRINFLPVLTPRGTIRLHVTPEVSSLDAANGISLSGFSVPAISTRRVETEIELQDGQTFAIAGLLDNRTIDALNKIPGLGDIPLLGKLFQSRSRQKSNAELLVVVTPEIVRPIPAGQPVPSIPMPEPFLKDAPTTPPRTPGMSVTGTVPVPPPQESLPVEQLQEMQKQGQASATQQAPVIQFVPVMPVQPAPAAQPQAPAAPAPAAPRPPAGQE